jgi:hypothetical protein
MSLRWPRSASAHAAGDVTHDRLHDTLPNLIIIAKITRDMTAKSEVLSDVSFGHRIAEDETDALETYFVETDSWKKLFSGEIDVVYGPKGAGKSALYTLLEKRRDQLFDRAIIVKAAENPRGAPAFKDLVVDPPTSELEFVGLWKLYCLCLLSELFADFGCNGGEAKRIRGILEAEGLLPSGSLKALIRAALDYVRTATRLAGVEGGVGLDPVTGMANGFSGKITFHEPSAVARSRGIISVDELLELANTELTNQTFTAWILLDRLDVAFAESPDLEQSALRALFKAYLDLLSLQRVRMKIFLRSDIWRRITSGGFREASHITRTMTIAWDRRSLLNLIVQRAVQNPALQSYYGVAPEDVLGSTESQRQFFYRMSPDQVDVGPNKPETLDWVLARCRDGSKQTAPREVIHLMASLRDEQIRRLELGDPEPEGELLFVRAAFKEALEPVSKARLEQTLYAEYPIFKDPLEKLRGEKTSYRVRSLAEIWNIGDDDAIRLAQQLAEVGFFEVRGAKNDPEYWVPFLYRQALDLVQGSAEG